MRISALAFLILLDSAMPQAVLAKRTVDYSVDDATLHKWAEEQELTPLMPNPNKSIHHIALDFSPGVDHEVVRGGLACSAWTIDNPISLSITAAITRWDREGRLATPTETPDLKVHIERASTLTRCVGTGELKSTCLSRVSIGALLTVGTTPTQSVHVTIERPTKAVGACAGLTRGIALVSREAAIALLAAIETPRTQ